MFNTVF